MTRPSSPASVLPLAARYASALGALCLGGALAGCATPAGTPVAANVTLPAELHIGPHQTLDQVLVTTGDETWRCGRDVSMGGQQIMTAVAAAHSARTSPGHAAGSNANDTMNNGATGTSSTSSTSSTPSTSGTSDVETPPLHWIQLGSAGTLVDRDRQNVGTVRPGGYFVATDGSYVQARMEHQSQVGANTLTWALYRVDRDVTSYGRGRFARITSIQRIDTSGGLPIEPTCSREGLHMLVPYRATYLLYRAGDEPRPAPAPVEATRAPQAGAVFSTAQVPPTSPQRIGGR